MFGFGWLATLPANLGYVDPFYVAQYRRVFGEIAKELRRHGYYAAGAQVIRAQGFAEIRTHWGLGDLIAFVTVQGSESLPTEAIVTSPNDLPDTAQEIFRKAFPKLTVCFYVPA